MTVYRDSAGNLIEAPDTTPVYLSSTNTPMDGLPDTSDPYRNAAGQLMAGDPDFPREGGGIDLDAFMAAQSDGFYFDFSKTDRLFQDDTGLALADDPGEVIGLALSQRTWEGKTRVEVLAAQPELVANGAMDSPTSWTDASTSPATFAVSGGQGVLTGTGSARARARQIIPTTAGRTHVAAVDISVASVEINLGTTAGATNIFGTTEGVGRYTRYFGAPSASAHLQFGRITSGPGNFDNVSIKEVPGKHATQATLNYRGKFQPTGKKYDGSDDFDSTPYTLSGATNAFVFDYADIPAVISATQIMLGTQNAGGEAFYLAVTTGGALRLKIGTTTIDSTGVDIRGGQHAVGAYTNGTTAYLLVDGVVVGSGTYSGSLPTTTWYLGAVNNNGTSAAFFGGSLKTPLTGRDALTLAQARQLSTAVAAA